MKTGKYAKGNIMTFPLELTQMNKEQSVPDYSYLYPLEVKEIQRKIEDACDRLEYDGSFMYDMYPDKVTLESMARKICGCCDCEYQEEISNRWMSALIQMMLCNEISYRRKRRACHKENMGKCNDYR